jgi:hypothetical protein
MKKIDLLKIHKSLSMSLFLNGATDDLSTSINLGTPKVNAAGGKNIPIFNKLARNGLKVETPMMLTWGINENQFDGSDKKSYDMSLQFPSAEYLREDTSAFLENMKKMNDYIKEQACINSKAWFGKVQSAEVVDAFWTPLLKYPKDKVTGEPDYSKSPTLRVKIPFWDGQFKCEIYNVHRELIFPMEGRSILDVVPKGSEVKVMLQCGGIWFAGGKFGVTWKPYQMIVKPKNQLLPGVCHISINDAEVKVEKVELPTEMIESDEDPEKEYAPPPPALARTLSEPGEPVEMTSEAPDVPEVPVKGRKKVVKT